MSGAVWIVEDDRALRTVLLRALEAAQLPARAFASLAEARAALAETTPAAILTDLRLPDGEGLELAALLGERAPQVPLLVMSAYTDIASTAAAYRAGAADYLAKPFDLEHAIAALRRALGDPQFNLVGVSYGTRVAQQFAMRHPGAVRSMVLDSVVPDTLILGQDFGVNLDQALRKDFALCTAEPACRKIFGDPWTTLLQLKQRLAKNTPVVRFRAPDDFAPGQQSLTPDRLIGLVRLYAYSPLTAALLPLTLHAADQGHYGPLLAQSRFISESLQHSLNDGLQLSVVCSEDAPWLKATPREAATLLGDGYIRQLQAQCAIWPRGAVPADFHQPLRGAMPTLILEGQFDPVTPPRYGDAVLKGLGDARLLIAPGQGHNVIGAGCMPRLVKRFIENPQPAKLDAQCLEALKPTPPFLDYNGGAP
ncbi:alpha/beta fold hydrolase [Metallibacterium sp.]|uniref:alpha/beta fold hydrolase n=1 Tax=Metallibacterium sp. TaxID=2940281 RepID=UPI00260209E1|nr:alpha/beta fold hydrolase [Metallibacterium sp.]